MRIVVQSHTPWKESLCVAAAVLGIVALAGLRVALLPGGPEQVHPQPYQRLDSFLKGDQRTLYQSLLSSVDEIVDLWRSEKKWPDVARLQAEQIPPFAPGLMPARLRGYRWSSYDQQGWVDYVGLPADGRDPVAFLLRIVDLQAPLHPHPHPSYDPSLKVASQVWVFFGEKVPYPVGSLLEADWLWIVNPADPSLKDRR